MPDLVAVEALLVLVGVRLGLSLALVILELGLLHTILALSVFVLAVLAFTLALEHGDVHRHDIVLVAGPGNSRYLSSHLVEGV